MTLDCSAGSQTFVEDCMVCCAPIVVQLVCDPVTGELAGLSAVRENE
ncbi:MAG: CPXCG motif-containing cysteine-rich protein [Chromatiaceae bacterium]|nr:CPXCG motif-containing cysteine-rich protein [Chromatiaceae bacterium]